MHSPLTSTSSHPCRHVGSGPFWRFGRPGRVPDVVHELERAKALAALGEALRRARRPTDAREPLRKALELAEVSGATALVERIRSEIYATGARPRTTALSGVGSLTASERRVAGLAADGLSNRDIAQTLYVTPKTVEVHLGNAYRKLGIASRRELPDALASAAA
jgi:DNA-binding NarL/FixJ family response regulator